MEIGIFCDIGVGIYEHKSEYIRIWCNQLLCNGRQTTKDKQGKIGLLIQCIALQRMLTGWDEQKGARKWGKGVKWRELARRGRRSGRLRGRQLSSSNCKIYLFWGLMIQGVFYWSSPKIGEVPDYIENPIQKVLSVRISQGPGT